MTNASKLNSIKFTILYQVSIFAYANIVLPARAMIVVFALLRVHSKCTTTHLTFLLCDEMHPVFASHFDRFVVVQCYFFNSILLFKEPMNEYRNAVLTHIVKKIGTPFSVCAYSSCTNSYWFKHICNCSSWSRFLQCWWRIIHRSGLLTICLKVEIDAMFISNLTPKIFEFDGIIFVRNAVCLPFPIAKRASVKR